MLYVLQQRWARHCSALVSGFPTLSLFHSYLMCSRARRRSYVVVSGLQEMNGILAILASILMITDITFDDDPDIGGVFIRDDELHEASLLGALEAGLAAGGEEGDVHSAALLVVHQQPTVLTL